MRACTDRARPPTTLTAVANRYASQQLDQSPLRASADLVVACAPMTSLVAGLGLGAAGYLLATPGLATAGAVVAAVGLYVERLQARTLRRRRRAERMRNRHEVTELRRTIAQLRLDVDAFQRALLDTEAALSARSLPLLPRVAAAAAPAAPAPIPVTEPAAAPVPVADRPVAEPAPVADPVAEPVAEPVAVPVVEPVVAWVQTRERDAVDAALLPAQQVSPFVAEHSGPLPVLSELPPRRTFDTGGIPVLDPAPRDRLSVTTDALVYAALTELDEQDAARRLAYPAEETAGAQQESAARSA